MQLINEKKRLICKDAYKDMDSMIPCYKNNLISNLMCLFYVNNSQYIFYLNVRLGKLCHKRAGLFADRIYMPTLSI